MRILNLGSMNMDKTYQVTHILEPKETLNATGYQEFCGGKGLNQSVAIARAGAQVYHAGMIGKGGERLRNVMREAGVHTELIEQTDGPSGHAIIQVDESGQNCILIFGGANEKISCAYIDRVMDGFGEGDLLLLQNEISNINYAIERAKEKGLLIAMNPSPFNERLAGYRMELVDYFILNEIEGRLLAQTDTLDAQEILEKLRERYPKTGFVLTFGEGGSYFQKGKEQRYQPIFPVEVCDTTGAGDTYCGYFLAGLAQQRPVEEILRRASAASALAVSRKGASEGVPSEQEVEEFLNQRL